MPTPPITPSTKVRLYSGIPIDPSYQKVLMFNSVQEQENYFAGRALFGEYTNFNYVQESGAIRVPVNREQLYNVNYIAYQNATFGDKWFYAFVTGTEYYSPNSTGIYFTIDEWQTWHLSLTYYKSFVERETVSNDTIGANTLPENVELGPYINTGIVSRVSQELTLYLMATYLPDEGLHGAVTNPGYIGGVPLPCYLVEYGSFDQSSLENLRYDLNLLTGIGKENGIVACFVLPQALFNPVSSSTVGESIGLPPRNSTITPRNNKLLTYPYCCASITGEGQNVVLRYENFDTNTFSVRLNSAFGPSGEAVVTPENYEGFGLATPYQVTCKGWPLLPWTSDYFSGWIARNAVPMIANMIGNIAITGAIVGTGGAALGAGSAIAATETGMVASTMGQSMMPGVSAALTDAQLSASVMGTASQGLNPGMGISVSQQGYQQAAHDVGAITQAMIMPDVMHGNALAPNTNCYRGMGGFRLLCRSIKPEYATIIDNYFSIYGYRVNQVKYPELNSRQNWNFIKTADANISGNCPQTSLTIIKNAFNNGITLFHTGHFDYGDLSNPIV